MTPPARQKFLPFSVWVGWGLVFVLGNGLGCGRTETSHEPTKPAAKSAVSVEQQLAEKLAPCLAAYHKARSYADSGEVTISVVQGGERRDLPPFPFSVTFERPSRLRLQAFGGTVVSDGKHLRGVVGDLSDQMRIVPLTDQLHYDDLFLDPTLVGVLQGGSKLPLVQVALLTARRPLEELFTHPSRVEELPGETCGEHLCQRVRVTDARGETVLWIDSISHLLRKVEFATAALLREGTSQPPLESLAITALFTGAKAGHSIPPAAFEMEVPAGTRLVRQFIPSFPRAPSSILGQPVGAFQFSTNHEPLTPAALRGKPAVLAFVNENVIENPEQVRRWQAALAKPELQPLASYVVQVGAQADSPLRLQTALQSQGVQLAAACDSRGQAESVLQLEQFPAVVLLDAEGTVQDLWYESDAEPEALAQVVPALVTGKPLFEARVAAYQQAMKSYQAEFGAQMIGIAAGSETAPVPLAPASSDFQSPYQSPQGIVFTPAWKCEALKPGNVLYVAQQDASPTWLVLDRGRSVVEIRDGQEVARHDLGLPEGSVACQLCRGADADGQIYHAVYSAGEQQIWVFDQVWKPCLTFPDRDFVHSGLANVQFARWGKADALSLLVAYHGAVGLQNVSLAGERLWRNRTVDQLLSMALVANEAGPELWCVSGRPTIARYQADGTFLGNVTASKEHLVDLVALRNKESRLAAVAIQEQAWSTSAVGLDHEAQTAWTFPLGSGIHARPVTPLVVADGPSPLIVVPAPDGTVTALNDRGESQWSIQTGERLNGLGCERLGDNWLLVVCGDDTIKAWTVSAPGH